MRFGSEDRLSRVQNLLSTELDQETVLMSIDAGAYYGLEGPARSIWEMLETPLTFSALVDRLVKEYRVIAGGLCRGPGAISGEMEREGLLRVE